MNTNSQNQNSNELQYHEILQSLLLELKGLDLTQEVFTSLESKINRMGSMHSSVCSVKLSELIKQLQE
jgi:hypothetical protein